MNDNEKIYSKSVVILVILKYSALEVVFPSMFALSRFDFCLLLIHLSLSCLWLGKVCGSVPYAILRC